MRVSLTSLDYYLSATQSSLILRLRNITHLVLMNKLWLMELPAVGTHSTLEIEIRI